MEKNSAEWLKANGFDGLFYPGSCACELKDLFPCGQDELIEDCTPGYKHIDPRGNKNTPLNWCISPSKDQPLLEAWESMEEFYSNE